MADLYQVTLTDGQANNAADDGTVATINTLLAVAPVSGSFTPAATSHTAGDSVGGAVTFTALTRSAKPAMLAGYSFVVNSSTVPTSAFTLWIFNSAPTVVADDAAFGVLSADRTKFVDKIDIATPVLAGVSGTATVSFSSGAIMRPIVLTSADAVCYLTNNTTYSTVAQAHTVTLYTYPLG